MPPRFDFAGSQNVKTVTVAWPAPHRFSDDGGITIGYKDNVIFPLRLVPQDAGKPVRLRIVKAFLGDRALTTGQLAAELDDVPAGSLYRHVALLSDAGILQVVAERRVRGTTERTYTLRMAAAQIQPGEARAMSFD